MSVRRPGHALSYAPPESPDEGAVAMALLHNGAEVLRRQPVRVDPRMPWDTFEVDKDGDRRSTSRRLVHEICVVKDSRGSAHLLALY